MKKSLRDRLQRMLVNMEERVLVLKQYVKEYKEENRLQEAVYNQIKVDQLELIAKELRKELTE
jgi:hypothetical protein